MDMNVIVYAYLHVDNFKLKEYTVPCEVNYTTGLGVSPPV